MRVPVSWLRRVRRGPRATSTSSSPRSTTSGSSSRASSTSVGASSGSSSSRVERIDAIEGADRIRLATVTDGEGTSTEVVCGAWNYEVGSLVPLAPVGTVLPDGMEIARRKLRGVVSNGMLCSSRELGLGDDQAGLLVLDPGEPAPGRPISRRSGIVPDTVLDLSSRATVPTPGAWRASRGTSPPEPAPRSPRSPPRRRADRRRGDRGRRGHRRDRRPRPVRAVRRDGAHGIVVGPSPAWLADRLERAACGRSTTSSMPPTT